MDPNFRASLAVRIGLLWRARAVLVLAQERQGSGRFGEGVDLVRSAGKSLQANRETLLEVIRLAGVQVIRNQMTPQDFERAIAECSAQISNYEREYASVSSLPLSAKSNPKVYPQ